MEIETYTLRAVETLRLRSQKSIVKFSSLLMFCTIHTSQHWDLSVIADEEEYTTRSVMFDGEHRVKDMGNIKLSSSWSNGKQLSEEKQL